MWPQGLVGIICVNAPNGKHALPHGEIGSGLGLDRRACSCNVALYHLGQPSAEASHLMGRAVRKTVGLSYVVSEGECT